MVEGKIKLEKIEEIADLAMLPVNKQEKDKFVGQFSKTIEVMDQLNEIKTEGVEPTAQVTGLTNVWREDEIDEARVLAQEEALSQARKTYKGYFVVDRLIE